MTIGIALAGPACGDDSGDEGVAEEGSSGSESGPGPGTGPGSGPGSESGTAPGESESGSGETGPAGCELGGEFADHDDSACGPGEDDYVPGTEDDFPACLVDDGEYHLVADTPSSIARTLAYQEIVTLLAGTPTADAFTEARLVYAQDQGLESRLVRREDEHFPPVPEEDWDPGVAADRQCTVIANVKAYPDRCAGPAKIAPLLNEEFEAGQAGEGVPEVHAARIDAALLWFLYLSVYKEARTCFSGAPQDCDSSWAYYTGGEDRDGGVGFSALVSAASPLAHEAIWNGFSAFRCVREIYPPGKAPSLDDLDEEGLALLAAADAQLDEALVYGLALVVRNRIIQQATVCDVEAEANWAFLKVLGPVLDWEGERRDAEAYAPIADLWAADAPTAEGLAAAVEAIDALFACPSA